MKSKISDVDKIKSFLVLCKPEFKKIDKDSHYVMIMSGGMNLTSSQLELMAESINEFFAQRNSKCIIILDNSSIKKSYILRYIHRIKKFLMVMLVAIRNKV